MWGASEKADRERLQETQIRSCRYDSYFTAECPDDRDRNIAAESLLLIHFQDRTHRQLQGVQNDVSIVVAAPGRDL